MQKEEVQQMLDAQTTTINGVVKKHSDEIREYMGVLVQEFQGRLKTTIEYFDGRFDKLENRSDRLEDRVEHIESDVVDIKYDLRNKVDIPA